MFDAIAIPSTQLFHTVPVSQSPITMLALQIGTTFARSILWILPQQWKERVKFNSSEREIFVKRSGEILLKPRNQTLVEAVFATLLFDLALFGTDNFIIRGIIWSFTKLQNSWDEPFHDEASAKKEVSEFCRTLRIQVDPWIWEKPIEKYTSLNEFFSRTYARAHAPTLGSKVVVSPACCVASLYRDDASLKRLLIKGCDYSSEEIGIPDIEDYRRNPVLIGYLSPADYHRVHAPADGTIVHLRLESPTALSASVKFFEGKFNILNLNKRLVVVLRQKDGTHIALVIVGGVGVNTIVYNNDCKNVSVNKGDELATFRAGGSAFAMFSTRCLNYEDHIWDKHDFVELQMGENVAD